MRCIEHKKASRYDSKSLRLILPINYIPTLITNWFVDVQIFHIIKKYLSMKYNTPQPTDAELDILQILWRNEPATVRFVNDKLNEKKDVGYTTTLKFMQIMLDKGLVRRVVEERVHRYFSCVEEEHTQVRLLEGFVDTTFGGSSSSLVMRALGSGKTTPEELELIKALIEELENKQSSKH
jgi:BlaI family transcriptional regulator, penicillinase repressor